MKIAPKAIESYIAKPEHRAVLLYGPDAGLVRNRAKKLQQWALADGSDPFALVELTGDQLVSNPARLADELSAIGLLSSQRVILITQAGDKLTGIIEQAASCLHDDVFLIACADELPTRSSLRAWFEASPQAAALACYHDEARDVAGLLRGSFEKAGIRAGGEVFDYLVSQLGNDRYVTLQEIEKLITYAGDSKQLSLDDVQALVDYNRETNFDDMVNAVADRNLQALDTTLTRLLREGTQPVAYLRALQRYFNRLYYIRGQMAATGQGAGGVIENLKPKVFFRQVPIMTRHAQNWGTEQIIKAIKLLVAAELSCKTSDLPVIPASSRRLLQVTQVR